MTLATITSLRVGIRVLALGLVAAACANEPEPSGDVAHRRASGDAITVVAEDAAFEPALLSAAAGERVRIEVTNNDNMAHDFAVPALDLNTGTVHPGEIATASFTMPDEPLDFVCTYHGGMSGRIEPR
jgi:plastocyanin